MWVCDYPAGYVEPRLEFWEAMGAMAASAEKLVGDLPVDGQVAISIVQGASGHVSLLRVDVGERKEAIVSYFARLGSTFSQLAAITKRQMAGEALTEREMDFMRSIVESPGEDCAGVRLYEGWYPAMYFDSIFITDKDHHSTIWDPLVVDVHTDAPSVCHGDPGAVLHQAVGNVDFMMLAVNCGERARVFGGPVFSYYEVRQPLPDLGTAKRLTDGEWKGKVAAGDLPPRPGWTAQYLAK